jgi:hypothetical protein
MAIDSILRAGGTTFAWTSSVFRIDGQLIEGVRDLGTFTEKLERPLVWASRRDGKPVAKAGGGKYTPPEAFKLKMLKDTAQYVKATILAPLFLGSSGGSGLPGFTFQAQLVEETSGLVVVTANASGCHITESDGGGRSQSSQEAIDEEWTIGALDFIENGVPLWSPTRSAGI